MIFLARECFSNILRMVAIKIERTQLFPTFFCKEKRTKTCEDVTNKRPEHNHRLSREELFREIFKNHEKDHELGTTSTNTTTITITKDDKET